MSRFLATLRRANQPEDAYSSRQVARQVRDRILIVGSGPAGLCAATVLGKLGASVDLIEVRDTIRPLGSGLALSGVTLRALEMVDRQMLDRCVSAGAPYPGVVFARADGSVTRRVALPQAASRDYPSGLGILRPILWKLLAETAELAGATVRLSTGIAALDVSDGAVEAEFTDGSRGGYDLVVGADGLRSTVRELVWPDAPAAEPTGQAVWRAVVPRAPDLQDSLRYYGPRNKAGCTPVSAEQMYVFVVENGCAEACPPRDRWPDIMQMLLSDYGGVIGAARKHIADPYVVDRRRLYSSLVPPPWHRGRVVLIGDAAHAPTPHLAMGAGLAMEDAVVLGQVLGARTSVGDALEAFTKRRFDRCRLVVESSRQMSEWEKRPDDETADPAALQDRVQRALAAAL